MTTPSHPDASAAKTFTFTAGERDVLLHRLGVDAISDCLASTEASEKFPDEEAAGSAWEEAYDVAYERFEAARAALEPRVKAQGPLTLDSPDDFALLRDAFEGSTYWGNIEYDEPAEKAAAMRVHNSLERKLAEVFDDLQSPLG